MLDNNEEDLHLLQIAHDTGSYEQKNFIKYLCIRKSRIYGMLAKSQFLFWLSTNRIEDSKKDDKPVEDAALDTSAWYLQILWWYAFVEIKTYHSPF